VLALSTWNLVACPVDHQERLALDDNHNMLVLDEQRQDMSETGP
jgi:uncharacterized protein YbaR (Trm112 family)